jgi:rare lipoprotein A
MQTKLRVGCLFFVAGLLWMSPMLVAKQAPQAKAVKKGKTGRGVRYTGVASWYGPHHQGRKMANGQKFDRHRLTAACWFLPLGSSAQVVNLKNGNTVEVTIADRGPNFRLNRIIDLSEAAATKLDFIHDGVTQVFLAPVASPVLEAADLCQQVIAPLYDVPPANVTAVSLLRE